LNLNYAIWNQFQIRFIYDEQTSIYQGASWTDARAEIRRLLATDFKRYGTISDAFGNCFIVNGSRIKSVTYSENTFQMLIVFKDDSTLLVRCVTDEIGSQNFRYVKFLKSSNDLANVRKNRNIKVIAQNAIQSDFIFPTFASLNENLNEGDYVIVNPGTYSMAESFTLKNGVDIEMKEDVIVNVNYTAGDSTENGIFTDAITTDALEFVGSTDKRIFARIFGDASISINDAPANRFTPLLITYYDSELYAQFSSWESNNAAPTIAYGRNGAITLRIEDITNAEQLLDNDYYCYAMDLDTLNASCIGSFFPGVDSNVTNPLAMIRNANIVSNAGNAVESISQASMVYHYINVYDTGNVTWDYDLFAQTGSQFYMHNAKIESEIFTSGTHDSTWYNNGFNNYINNSTGSGGWTFIEDSLTLE
jgi:hypothetical protein